MKIFKYVIVSVFCLLVGLSIGVYGYLQYLKPSYKGTAHIDGVQGTEVYFDSIGVPHIFANSEKDAMTVLGYVHAQERLWQMELLRRIASGRLAEVLGKDLVDVDVFFSNLGVDETVEKQVLALNKNSKVKGLVNAYLKGINTYIDNGVTPIEFSLLGIEKEHYTPKDIYYVTAYMAFSFAHAFKTDPVLTHIKNNLGTAYLKDLAIDADENTVYQENYDVRKNSISSINHLLEKLPFPQFIGSNGWVLAPEKTTTGKVLFENDPHIGFAQPQVWYQAHIKTPTYENYGFYLGLFPFPLLAHNRDYAFGLTMFENDDLDFYQINQNPKDSTKYSVATGFYDYEFVEKEIKIKGETSKKMIIKKTVLGTVFNVSSKNLDSVPTVVNWVYNEKPNQVLQTAYGMNHANNIDDFENAIATLSAPGLNFVYGDKKNNIGLWSAGQLYKHISPEVNTKFVLDGTDLSEVQKEWLPFTKNPKAINPPKGYLFTSNVQPEAIDGDLYPGYYLSQDRAVAIKKGIEAKEKLSVSDMKSLVNSHTNTTAIENIKDLVDGIDLDKLNDFELNVLDRLVKWKGNHHLENIEPTIYYKLTFRLWKNTFEDELGADDFKDFVNSNLSRRTQNKYLKNPNSVWWDNISTLRKETFKDIVTLSFKNAVTELKATLGEDINEWKWGKVHTVTHEHALAKIDLLKKIFNVGAFPMVGGNETINNLMFDYTEGNEFKVNAGPSSRRVIDFSDIENSYAVTPTGQSGYFLSPFYSNQTNYYNTGKYYKMLMNEEEIKTSTLKLIFE
ncbi:penicillin acylase family protein [Wenyingzhuangia sp. IMCC45467]